MIKKRAMTESWGKPAFDGWTEEADPGNENEEKEQRSKDKSRSQRAESLPILGLRYQL